ncbi:AAA family ATPase [Colletotrichum plurivorum]|uniref:AAA family ATPase n=1 Tax=Colletotrichum plurivorum TaxID=2175906 RepID=A0A8H6N7W3_9PEZI|nr:AAA family ATPase [Colletotrichum plurivorum]
MDVTSTSLLTRRHSVTGREPHRLAESQVRWLQAKQPKYRPIVTIDWRAELCDLLNEDPNVTDSELIKAKESAIDTLKEAAILRNSASQTKGPPKYEIIHKIYCHELRTENLFLDKPWVVESGRYGAHLRGSRAIPHLELHLERNKEITFIVYRNFECCGEAPPKTLTYHGRVADSLESDASSFLKTEYMHIISEELSDGLQELAYSALAGIPHPRFDKPHDEEISYPYLWWFHRRNEIESDIEKLGATSQKHVSVLRDYIRGQLAKEWSMVDLLLNEGRMTAEYIRYLFVPNTILISKTEGTKTHQLRGLSATDWIKIDSPTESSFSARIDATTWDFTGTFQKIEETIAVEELPEAESDGSFLVQDLVAYPMEYASKDTVGALRKRGQMFWKCRHRNYVSSSRFSDDGIQAPVYPAKLPVSDRLLTMNFQSDSRFMVDYGTYTQMHDRDDGASDDDLGPAIMAQDEPNLGDEFFMCLPTSIQGFNMQKKEWVKLEVAFLEDVEWNDQAFEHLVIDTETKELVKAVVTTQLRAEENTDLIQGKGNGGPGTGKTLTAESVAEIARKPLYRVTCGDIGTKAEEVEKYLDTVLLLGKTWGCVVLLDEADVFLEERTLKNLERNALVSVFLRVLEYYDGILILTSNRVGTFDEAFKSRIQLNLRYKNLSEDQRLKIWKNFIDRIEKLDKLRIAGASTAINNGGRQDLGLNTEEIRSHLPELAQTNLNGREIRNAISTARQLAVYREQPLGYKHITSVIGEAKKFDEYLKELKQGYSADDISHGQGVR